MSENNVIFDSYQKGYKFLYSETVGDLCNQISKKLSVFK